MKTATNHIIRLALLSILIVLSSTLAIAGDGPTSRSSFYGKKSSLKYANFRATLSTAYINTASGHNSGTALTMSIGTTRQMVEFGAILNNSNQQFSGLNLRMRQYLIPNFSNASVYVQASAMYRFNDELRSDIATKMYSSDYAGAQETFSTIEAYAGVGYQQMWFANIYTDFSIGLGGYSRSLTDGNDNRCCEFARFSDDKGIGVNIKLSIGIYLW